MALTQLPAGSIFEVMTSLTLREPLGPELPRWEYLGSRGARLVWRVVAALGAGLLGLGFWLDEPAVLLAGLLAAWTGISEQVPGDSGIARVGGAFIATALLVLAVAAGVIAALHH